MKKTGLLRRSAGTALGRLLTAAVPGVMPSWPFDELDAASVEWILAPREVLADRQAAALVGNGVADRTDTPPHIDPVRCLPRQRMGDEQRLRPYLTGSKGREPVRRCRPRRALRLQRQKFRVRLERLLPRLSQATSPHQSRKQCK